MRQLWTISGLIAAAALGGCMDDETTDLTSTTSPTTGATSTSSTTGGPCTPPEQSCGIACVNTDDNVEHCGACFNACAESQICSVGACTCAEGQIDCGNGCIDPLTDPTLCGASGDCMGPNAGEVCGPSEACDAGVCGDTCVNCSFESGDFAGWTVADLDSPLFALQVGGEGLWSDSSLFWSEPTDGAFALLTGFEGGQPGTITAGQDITIAPGLAAATLEFDYRVGWILGGTLDRTFSAQIEPAGGGTAIRSEVVFTITASSTELDSGPLQGSVDLTEFIGETVFVDFVWDVPEANTGSAFFQLDNVRITGT